MHQGPCQREFSASQQARPAHSAVAPAGQLPPVAASAEDVHLRSAKPAAKQQQSRKASTAKRTAKAKPAPKKKKAAPKKKKSEGTEKAPSKRPMP